MKQEQAGTRPGGAWSGANPGRWLDRAGRRLTTLTLDLFTAKPILGFVWVFSQLANRVHFPGRRDLLRRCDRALAERRPVIVAVNHVSWFDDPVIPAALYGTGPRALIELLALAGLAVACWWLTPAVLPPPAGIALVVAAAALTAWLGARKAWWTLGDLVNLSDASVLRGKLALTRSKPPGPLLRAGLRLADALIPWFMRSDTTKTVFVDRRPGEAAKLARARALERSLEIAARPAPFWVFFEGGRSRVPGVLAPARRGVGSLILGLRERGLRPFVAVVCHRGMERLIPPGGSRFLGYGHRVEVRWSVLDVDAAIAAARSDQELAETVRAEAVRLQAGDGPVPAARG